MASDGEYIYTRPIISQDLLAKRLPKNHARHNDQAFSRLLDDLDYFKADSGAFYAKELVLDLVRSVQIRF